MNRRTVLKGAAVAGPAAFVGYGASEFVGSGPSTDRTLDWGDQAAPEPYSEFEVHHVDAEGGADHETIQDAVDVAEPRDLVLIEPGVYREEVTIGTDRLTIRGTDRDGVIIDGEFGGRPCITALADDVVVENLTVRHGSYGVYWTGVEGYRASHVVAYNNSAPDINGYGIYAFNSRYGRFEYSYASGSDDAGIYIGESQPADAVITDCIVERNALGYSGTNAGGNFVIKDSLWQNNMAGIVPNTLDSQEGAPQGHIAGGVRIENNTVIGNNNLTAPAMPFSYPPHGIGIAIAGGTQNDVVGNEVHDQAKYGIAVTPIIDENFYRPRGNAVEANTVRNSGRVDLALLAPASNNAFADNDFSSSRPTLIEQRDGSFGDLWGLLTMLKDYGQTELGSFPHGAVADQPPPSSETLAELPEMDAPSTTPPASPIGGR